MKANRLMVAVALALVFCAAGQLHAQEVTFEGKTLTQWVAELRDGDWEQRLMAAWALAEIGPAAAAAVPELIKALEDQDESLRMYSAYALGAIGQATDAVRDALQKALKDPDEQVREQAAWALEQLAAAGEEAPTVPPAVTPTPAPAPTQATEGWTAEPPAVGPAPVEGAPSEEEARMAVEAMLRQSFSLGLVDEAGNQLNPNVPQDATSLSPADLEVHAKLIADGSYRTIAYVVEFLAGLDLRLAGTGRTITVEDLLPDLQSYVKWSFAHRDDPRSALGLQLATGPDLTVPEAPPTMSGETQISPLAALMLVADILIGVPEQASLQGALPGRLLDGLMLAWAGAPGEFLLGPLGAVSRDADTVARVRGLVTAVEPFAKLTGKKPAILHWLKTLLSVFEVQNRVSIELTSVYGKRRPSQVEFPAQEGRIGVMARLAVVGIPFQVYLHPEYHTVKTWPFVWTWRLTSPNDPASSGLPLFADADAEFDKREPYGDPPGNPHRIRYTSKGTVIAWLQATKLENAQERKALLTVHASLPALDAASIFENRRVVLELAQVSRADLQQLIEVDMVRDLRPAPARLPVIFKPVKQTEVALRATDLLGQWTTQVYVAQAHVTVAGGGGVSGRLAFADNRKTAEWEWLTLLSSFSGQMTEFNPRYEEQRKDPESRDSWGEIEIGKFEATGSWQGVKLPRGAEMGTPFVKGLTGKVRLKGALKEDKKGYVVRGEAAFRDGDEWFAWSASESQWKEELADIQRLEREWGEKIPFPHWEHPDWLEDDP